MSATRLLAALVYTSLLCTCKLQVVDVVRDKPLDAAVDASAAPLEVVEARVLCAGGNCACNNGLDDDNDGLTDGEDPECTGPYDDDERSFATGIPGGEALGCRDCFFDANASASDDGCYYDPDCGDGPGRGPDGDNNPSSLDGSWEDACGASVFECRLSAKCISSCRDLTPNGCDCFGCCEMRMDGAKHTVLLLESCSLDRLDDEEACPPCKRNKECQNPCGMCELCPGRGVEDLPASCEEVLEPDGPGYDCEEWTVCGAGRPCAEDFYCSMGCCLPILF